MSNVVVFFDFDGTFTNSDSLIMFLRNVRGTRRFAVDILSESFNLTAYMFRLIRNDEAKEALIRRTLGGMPIDSLRVMGKKFSEQVIPGMLRNDMLERMQEHKAKGHCCVLVSASLDIYLEPWAKSLGFDYWITSSMETDNDGLVTGKLSGGNCYGDEKIRRIHLLLDKIGSPKLTYGYGNSHGDLPMLTFVDQAYLVKRAGIVLFESSER